MNALQVIALFGGGMVAGLAIGLLVGNGIGFHFGKLVERKRLARIMANKTALEVVQSLIAGSSKKQKRQRQAQPRDETRH